MDISYNNFVKKETKQGGNKMIIALFITLFGFAIMHGIFGLFNGIYSTSSALLMILENMFSLLIVLLVSMISKYTKVKISNTLLISLMLFLFSSTFLGETLEFYYKVSWWDKMLHTLSGFGITLVAYSFLKALFIKKGIKNLTSFILIISVMFSLSMAVIWELYEYTADTFFGTNMQKFIPENDLFNDGNSKLDLNGTHEMIYDFYKSPKGYKYALEDTMGDIIVCIIGTLVFCSCATSLEKKEIYVLDKLIYIM